MLVVIPIEGYPIRCWFLFGGFYFPIIVYDTVTALSGADPSSPPSFFGSPPLFPEIAIWTTGGSLQSSTSYGNCTAVSSWACAGMDCSRR